MFVTAIGSPNDIKQQHMERKIKKAKNWGKKEKKSRVNIRSPISTPSESS
jgi:hypothetical protein